MKRFFSCRGVLITLCVVSVGEIAADEAERLTEVAAQNVPSYVVHRVKSRIVIDGRIDEEDWRHAKSVGNFVFGYLKKETGDEEQTVFKILWDDTQLYFAVICEDRSLLSRHTDRDGRIPEDDSVEVYITPNPEKAHRHYAFYANVLAALYDEKFAADGTRIQKEVSGKIEGRKSSWDSKGVLVATRFVGTLNNHEDTDRFWSMEMAIPFENFADSLARLPPRPNDVWRLNPNRHAYMPDKSCLYSQWAPTIATTGSFWGPELFGKVVFTDRSVSEAKRSLLFVDWHHVETGRLKPTYDPERLSAAGREQLENTKKVWNIIPDYSGHGMKRVKLAYGVRIRCEKASKSEPWLEADQPWEQRIGGYVTVIQEDGKYRCWYAATLTKVAREQLTGPDLDQDPPETFLAYAESVDSVRWVKPAMGIYHVQGKPTNLLTFHARETAIFRDDSAPPEERYKCFKFGRLPDTEGEHPRYAHGLYGSVSPDGYHWTPLPDPLLTYFHDTQNVGAWDPVLRKYVGYFRGHHNGRAIGRSETDDFRKWPPARVFFAPGPEDSPFDDYYTNGFTFYPGDPTVRLLFPAIYHHDTDQLDIRLAVSRDNYAWNWVSHEPIIDIGNPGEWDCGSLYAGPNLVRLPDGRLALPISGAQQTHNESFDVYEDMQGREFQTAWAMWEDGRLAGIEASERGEFWVPLEVFDGDRLTINARTSRVGKVEVALHAPYGRRTTQPIPGYTFAECVAFNGDATAAPLEWKGGNLAELRGKKLFLHFRLSSAKVFGVRVDSTEVLDR